MAAKDSLPRKPSKKANSLLPSTTSSTTGSKRNSTSKTKTRKKAAKDPGEKDSSQTVAAETGADSSAHPDDFSDTAPKRTLKLTDSTRELLTPDEQDAYLQLLARGGSPAGACLQLGISLAKVAATLEASHEFASLVQRVQALLSQNVAAALYRSAMEGSVTAQQFYLKNRPPPEWPVENASSADANFESMSNEELQELTRSAIADFLAAEPSALGLLPRPVEPGSVPQTDLH